MTVRFICPHCHSSIDPLTMEAGDGMGGRYRICPDCDQPILLAGEESPVGKSPDGSIDAAMRSSSTVTHDCVL